MADKAEKDLDQASDFGWVRGLDAAGKPIRIRKDDMIELIRSEIPVVTSDKSGFMPSSGFIVRKSISKTSNYNECLNSGIYRIIDDKMEAANNPGINYGVLCVFSTGTYLFQLAISVMNGAAKTRTRTESLTEWRAWVNI